MSDQGLSRPLPPHLFTTHSSYGDRPLEAHTGPRLVSQALRACDTLWGSFEPRRLPRTRGRWVCGRWASEGVWAVRAGVEQQELSVALQQLGWLWPPWAESHGRDTSGTLLSREGNLLY